ncbi:hypothetical protein SAMN05660284_01140 [Formivibrio citricus]|uniref:CDP-Glycerol:Poly(Glycerophosphate) glycerophosphotransferase n=1 Tax=Formivibrio citricus TaxID=83765 RepID=A0A1I4XVI1_9NEIS|nr:hypothetical protein [Formivibrio citricus]SFN29901.1 hypothetical protein SAMN05660284_01140 [Formivibrio citricus]
MRFYESLGACHVVRLALAGEQAFFCFKSISARLAEKIVGIFGLSVNARKIDFGDLQHATQIRDRAYRMAEQQIIKLDCAEWTELVGDRLGIDFSLLFRKYIFDWLYVKFEFYEIILQYANENPNVHCAIRLHKEFAAGYISSLKQVCSVTEKKEGKIIGFLSILLLPTFLYRYWKQCGSSEVDFCVGQLVCEVEDYKTAEMFSAIFHGFPNVCYVVDYSKSAGLPHDVRERMNVRDLKLDRPGYEYLRRAAWHYIAICLANIVQVWPHGARLFRVFYMLMRARAEAVAGNGNVFCVYEHQTTEKAARNEFIRQQGGRSVFVPLNAHVTPQFFHSEIFINYDVMCAAGPHTAELYTGKRALTKHFPGTGSFDAHRILADSPERAQRIARLKQFKGDAMLITVISPGICDPTYSHEIRLMQLACKLSCQPGVKVAVRLKPVPPERKYSDFYADITKGYDQLLLTGSEHDLFDFLDMTDLFVTSISNAACDVLLRGAQVMFIDYLKDPDFFLWWRMAGESLLTEECAFDRIMAWVNDGGDGPVRAQLRQDMKKVSSFIGWKYPDFEAYRANLLNQLAQLLPLAAPGNVESRMSGAAFE